MSSNIQIHQPFTMHSNIALVILATTFLFAFSNGSVLGRFRRQAMPVSEESNSTGTDALPQDDQMMQNVSNNSTMDNSTLTTNSDSDSGDIVKGDKIVLEQPTIVMMHQPVIMVDGGVDLGNLSNTTVSMMPMHNHGDNDDNDDDDDNAEGEDEDHEMHPNGEHHDNDDWEESSNMTATPSVQADNHTDSDVVYRYRRQAGIIIFPGANSTMDVFPVANATIDDQSNWDNSTMNGTHIEDNDEAEHSVDPETPVEDSDANEMDENDHDHHHSLDNENENEHHDGDQEEDESTTAIWSSTSEFSSTATSTSNW